MSVVSFVCQSELGNQSLTLLNSIHLWVSLIHTTIAGYPTPNENSEDSNEEERQEDYAVQPQILLVGTHRNAVHGEPITRNQIVKEIFDKIYGSFENKSYSNHLHKNYIALDSKEMSFDEPNLILNFRMLIENLIVEEKVTGFNIPLPWLQLEHILEKLKQRGIYFVDINQLHEVVSSQVECFHSYDNLNAALHFFHNQSKIFYLDCVSQFCNSERPNSYELGIIILNPNWFINCIYQLCLYLCNDTHDDDNLQLGIIR